MALAIYKDPNQNLMLMQNNWARQLNPLLANPLNSASILKNVQLDTGTNVINHLLGKNLQGWSIVRQRSAASVYDTQDTNQQPNLTLVLWATAPVVVDLAVF